jgi:hypothetical protein
MFRANRCVEGVSACRRVAQRMHISSTSKENVTKCAKSFRDLGGIKRGDRDRDECA